MADEKPAEVFVKRDKKRPSYQTVADSHNLPIDGHHGDYARCECGFWWKRIDNDPSAIPWWRYTWQWRTRRLYRKGKIVPLLEILANEV